MGLQHQPLKYVINCNQRWLTFSNWGLPNQGAVKAEWWLICMPIHRILTRLPNTFIIWTLYSDQTCGRLGWSWRKRKKDDYDSCGNNGKNWVTVVKVEGGKWNQRKKRLLQTRLSQTPLLARLPLGCITSPQNRWYNAWAWGTPSEALVRIGLNWSFPTIQFTSKGLPGKLFFFA